MDGFPAVGATPGAPGGADGSTRGTSDPSADGDRGLVQHTMRLDPAAAGALADPGAATQVLSRAGHRQVEAPTQAPSGASRAAAPAPLISRRAAAEVGMYAGAALVVLAIAGVAARGWSDWAGPMRVASTTLAAVALVAAGLFVRLPWGRRMGDERRRAVSAMLTAGTGLALVAAGVALEIGQGADPGPAAGHGVVAVGSLMLVALVARSPLAETAVLAALAWAVWILVPPGWATWAGLAGLGVAWVLVAGRYGRGRRTAAVAGSVLALAASVGLSEGAWAWGVRSGLAALTVGGLVAFLRGWANHWLALGAGSATALAASVAGAALGPALALLIGGLATMAVSAIALRAARRAG